jgi:hypothetical protein
LSTLPVTRPRFRAVFAGTPLAIRLYYSTNTADPQDSVVDRLGRSGDGLYFLIPTPIVAAAIQPEFFS